MGVASPEELAEISKLVSAVKLEDTELVNELASGTLICNDGGCNWTTINELERQLPGLKVVALEKDSFGWLVGGIKYEGKVYSYG